MSNPKISGLPCRRKLSTDNVPIGPWMIIEMANAHTRRCRVIASNITKDLPKDQVWIPKILRLQISKEKIDEIINGETVVSHDSSPMWEQLFDYPDVIMFYSQDGLKKLYCTIDGVQRIFSCYTRQKRVRLVINKVIIWY